MSKILLSLVMAFAVTFSLIGCQKAAEQKEESMQESPAPMESAPSESPAPAPEGGAK